MVGVLSSSEAGGLLVQRDSSMLGMDVSHTAREGGGAAGHCVLWDPLTLVAQYALKTRT
jgi:hypothetical protein